MDLTVQLQAENNTPTASDTVVPDCCAKAIQTEFLKNKCLPNEDENLARNVHLTQDVWSGLANKSFLGD